MSEREPLQRTFTLVGGPSDGRALPLSQCQHGGWPALTLFGSGVEYNYRHDEAADTYVYIGQSVAR